MVRNVSERTKTCRPTQLCEWEAPDHREKEEKPWETPSAGHLVDTPTATTACYQLSVPLPEQQSHRVYTRQLLTFWTRSLTPAGMVGLVPAWDRVGPGSWNRLASASWL